MCGRVPLLFCPFEATDLHSGVGGVHSLTPSRRPGQVIAAAQKPNGVFGSDSRSAFGPGSTPLAGCLSGGSEYEPHNAHYYYYYYNYYFYFNAARVLDAGGAIRDGIC